MLLRTLHAQSDAYRLRAPHCPTCGEPLLLPEAAEFGEGGVIRHLWVCEECGSAFTTAIVVARR